MLASRKEFSILNEIRKYIELMEEYKKNTGEEWNFEHTTRDDLEENDLHNLLLIDMYNLSLTIKSHYHIGEREFKKIIRLFKDKTNN